MNVGDKADKFSLRGAAHVVAFCNRRTFGHDRGGARNRIGEIEVINRIREAGVFRRAAQRCKGHDVGTGAGRNLIQTREMRVGAEQACPQPAEQIVRKLATQDLRARAGSPSPRVLRQEERTRGEPPEPGLRG